MKRITLLVLVLLVMIVASACGSPAPAATEVPATEPIAQATEPPVQPSATEAPTQPTATESAPSANSIEVIITLEDNTITRKL